jgi:asparagine synthase (glutamine-hydrolysing)
VCGIAGCVVVPGAEPDRERLERVGRAIAHRGPDDAGVEVLGSVGLVHRRLAIVDVSPAGHQPMSDHAGRWWLTYNGEVFNHRELRADLPVHWRGGSDTETLVEALAAWGEDAIPRCNGLYAYAALDAGGRRLLLVRDRFGVKPLYIARCGGAIWFASEIGALLEAGVPRQVRPLVLRHAIHTGWANGRLTPVEGVDRVLPGTLVTVDLDTLAIAERRWYDPLESVDPERMMSFARAGRAEAVAAVEDALRTSVRRRLMADVPLGTMCSGGIDSSLITAFAAEAGTVHAFNARIIDQPDADEGAWARAVADHVGVELHTIEMNAASWRQGLVDVVRHIEYPLTHESSIPMAAIAHLANATGVKVLLSGEGADELFGGYSWLHRHEFSDFEARRRRPEAALRGVYRALQRRGLAAGRVLPEPRPGFSEDAIAYDREWMARGAAAYRHHGGVRARLEGKLAADLATYLPHLLNRQDKSTMMHSIETRVPFLDPDVVALALQLPLEVRIEPERKAPLREIGRRLLPATVVGREKVGFGFSASKYLGTAVRREFVADGLMRETLGVDRDTWNAHVDEFRVGLRPVTGEIWLRAVLHGQATSQIQEDLWLS